MSMEPSLSLVKSEHKRKNILEILENKRARHNQRLWMVGFLFYAGYSISDVCRIIRDNCFWADYDQNYTEYQVNSIYSGKGRNNGHAVQSLHPPQRVDDLIEIFLKNTEPIKLTIPSNISGAVAVYTHHGFTCIPKAEGGKYPAFDWAKYQHQKPTCDELMGWDFSNGICLLANEQYSFLDIDQKGYESCFVDRHVEKTPRGGLHVFGIGKLKSINIDGAEIKGIGTLIVTAPTPGYRKLFV